MKGYTTRAPTSADAEAMFDVAYAGEVADAGRSDWSLADVRNELADPQRHGMVVADGDGRVVAWALVSDIDASAEVHPDFRGQGIGSFLADEVERLAGGPVIRQEIMSASASARALLEARGYEQDQHYWLMERDLSGDDPAPQWPPRIDARRFQRGADDLAAYLLVADAMRDIPGDTERSFEHWSRRALGEGLVPELSTVAGDMAGVALCQRAAHEGYVDYLAVARDWRGRGIGRALLHESFRLFAAAGLGRAMLWVNGTNESAIALYRSVGMNVAVSADRFVKRLAP